MAGAAENGVICLIISINPAGDGLCPSRGISPGAAAVGEDVAALVLFRRFGGVLHVSLPTGYFFVQSLRNRRDESGLGGLTLPFWRLNAKARLLSRAFFYLYFYCSEVSRTKMPHVADLFFGCRFLILGHLWFLGTRFSGFWGLT